MRNIQDRKTRLIPQPCKIRQNFGTTLKIQRGKRFMAAEQLELAIAEFQQVVLLDPGHQYAANELRRAVEAMSARGGAMPLSAVAEQLGELESLVGELARRVPRQRRG